MSCSDLIFDTDGTPRSKRFDDIYYSPENGLEESRHVFLKGCDCPRDWQDRPHYAIGELGFGTGLNLCAVIDLWRRTRRANAHLSFFSLEAYLIDEGAARQALGCFPELADIADAVLAQWPKARIGTHIMDFPVWGVSVTLSLMPIAQALMHWHGPIDAWFLDGFSPAQNPEMWGDETFQALSRLSRPGARLASFTVAGGVRRAAQNVGFTVEKVPGFGRKRQCLSGVYGAIMDSSPPRAPRCAVIGAGIAGASLAWHLKSLGAEPVVFEALAPGAGASGNPLGLVSPRFDAGDLEIAGLFADALDYASGLYRRVCPDALSGMGVRQVGWDDKDRARHHQIMTQPCYAEGQMQCHEGDLILQEGFGLRPHGVLTALLDEVSLQKAAVGVWRKTNDLWALFDRDGQALGSFDQVFIACGAGVFEEGLKDKDEVSRLELRPVRGQMEWIAQESKTTENLSWGGYLVQAPEGMVFGATHERDDLSTEARESERQMNRQSLSRVRPEFEANLEDKAMLSRASVRVMTRDYLPVCGEIDSGLFILSGLGARGFCLGPLLARYLRLKALGLAHVLSPLMQKRLSPQRLSLRSRS